MTRSRLITNENNYNNWQVADLSKKDRNDIPEPPLTPVEPLLYEPHWTGDVLKLLMHITRKLNEIIKKIDELDRKIAEVSSKVDVISKRLSETY